MISVAIVTAFSEDGYQLLRQCLASLDIAISQCSVNAKYTIFCYQCNFQMNGTVAPFVDNLPKIEDIPLKHANIEIKNAASLPILDCRLPDIRVYHDFAVNMITQFDYTLFCHNDVYFRPIPLFDELIKTIDQPGINLIAQQIINCRKDISIRFHPCFIFVKNSKFIDANLSFINDYEILNDKFKIYKSMHDGGAGLLTSYYHKNNKSNDEPLSDLPKRWFKHLRFNSVHGIEMYNLYQPHSLFFEELTNKAETYANSYFFRTI